jgi:hypothetical protein
MISISMFCCRKHRVPPLLIALLSSAGMLRVCFLLDRLNLDQKYTTRGVHFYNMAGSPAVQCSADGAESRNAMPSNIRVIRPSERIYFALTRLNVTNMNPGSDSDDFFIECLEQHGKSS